MRLIRPIAAALLASAAIAAPVFADDLAESFQNPPDSARPRVWWHWMNGNVTKDGIAKDFAWMKRVGIGGVQNFDANLQTPQVVDKRLVYMTPEWKDAFRFAAQEADRLGLELTIAASPGWSETGGPWVPAADGLKKLVWSEATLEGGKRFTGKLAAPPSTTGPFGTIGKQGSIEDMLGGKSEEAKPRHEHYGDVAVLAFPRPAGGLLTPVSVRDQTGKSHDAAVISDSDLARGAMIQRPTDGTPPIIELDYGKPVAAQTLSLFAPGAAMMWIGALYEPVLEASDDGSAWRKVAEIRTDTVPVTYAFPAETARYFRMKFNARAKIDMPISPGEPGTGSTDVFASMAAGFARLPLTVGDFRLTGETLVDQYEAKAAYSLSPDYYALTTKAGEAAGVDPAKVIDLTSRMKADGSLDWTPPRLPGGGSWRVLRLGHSLLGTENHPAPPEATGLEVDKFDGPAVRRYMEHYIGMYRDAAGTDLVGKRGVQAVLTDSIEVGAANWTPQMVAQFKRLRGYDPTPWLPVLTGTLVGSRADSDKFLFDFRTTLADLMASEHYGTVAAVAREQGLKVYGEALENGRPSIGDDMAMRRHADIPMSAMWTHSREEGPRPSHVIDMRGAASVAHIYGQNLVAAESMTAANAPWAHAPNFLKRIIDLEFVNGVNRPVVHTSVHQPKDDKVPGLSLFIFGQYFNRHDAWADMAKPWVDYMSRNSLMLQQGRNTADLVYFYGEEAPLTALQDTGQLADVPKAHAHDFVNRQALFDALSNDGGELVSTGGARYKALYLGGSSRMMTLATLRRIAALAEGGATVIGMAPTGNPSLADDKSEYAALAAKLWSGADRTEVGKGQVIASRNAESALAGLGIKPQFAYSGGSADSKIPFVQRHLSDGESFLLVNQQDRTEAIEARFRVTGKAPELWRAETGKSEPLSYRTEDGVTIVPLTLTADESVHVVFRKPATAPSLAINQVQPTSQARLEGAWDVSFQAGRGAPPSAKLANLASLSSHSDPGIKYFSGIATYKRLFSAPRGWKRGQPLWLDLGAVRDVAEVTVNGKVAGSAWHAPYRIDIGTLALPYNNRLEVRVANTWVNRLIGDAQSSSTPGAAKITWTPMPTYKADAELRPSGLIGPVSLLTAPAAGQ